jgi:hypothetical protein
VRVLAAATGLAIVALLAVAVWPDVAGAALQSAAGGKTGDAGGFARFAAFLDHVSSDLIPIGAAFAVLGLIWAGFLFLAGDSRAGRVLCCVVLGLAIVLLSKPLAA